ncbi:MAG: 23S rRNA (pseudouridine(1915)-N(3))-methyltransferase RlmH [Granulosicoccaceae bacterium]|jgi:23S rRNA (pseudouridine1915-N3)-methyltransferase
MHIHVIAIGQRMPGWIQQGVDDYAKRLPPQFGFRIIELAATKRGSGAPHKAIAEEGERLLQAVPKGARIIALDERGRQWQTRELARALDDWTHDGRDVALLIGGADGHSDAVRSRAERLWSLSALTLPHGLVRVVLTEQLYRAWSLLGGHPYHRD